MVDSFADGISTRRTTWAPPSKPNQGFGRCSNHVLTMIFWDLLVSEGFGRLTLSTKGHESFVLYQWGRLPWIMHRGNDATSTKREKENIVNSNIGGYKTKTSDFFIETRFAGDSGFEEVDPPENILKKTLLECCDFQAAWNETASVHPKLIPTQIFVKNLSEWDESSPPSRFFPSGYQQPGHTLWHHGTNNLGVPRSHETELCPSNIASFFWWTFRTKYAPQV